MCWEMAHFCSNLTQSGTQLHGQLHWCDWHWPRMWDLDPGKGRLAASLAALSPAPVSHHPWERAEPAGNEPSLPLLPCFTVYIKTNMFSKAFQFLMKTSAFMLCLGLGMLVFWPPSLFGFPWDYCWLCAPISCDGNWDTVAGSRGHLCQHVPTPAMPTGTPAGLSAPQSSANAGATAPGWQ